MKVTISTYTYSPDDHRQRLLVENEHTSRICLNLKEVYAFADDAQMDQVVFADSMAWATFQCWVLGPVANAKYHMEEALKMLEQK